MSARAADQVLDRLYAAEYARWASRILPPRAPWDSDDEPDTPDPNAPAVPVGPDEEASR